MITAWRIARSAYAAEAFTGNGAVSYAGRWHSEGTRVVYTAESAALATLEVLVHLGTRSSIPSYVVIPCSFDEALVQTVDVERLPSNWADAQSPPALRAIGDHWVRSGASAVLKVPAAVTRVEFNYLLNPRHPGFASINIGEPRAFRLDVRLVT